MLVFAVCRYRQIPVYKGMAKEEAIEVMAKVLETLPNAMFRGRVGRKPTSGFGTYFGKNA